MTDMYDEFVEYFKTLIACNRIRLEYDIYAYGDNKKTPRDKYILKVLNKMMDNIDDISTTIKIIIKE